MAQHVTSDLVHHQNLFSFFFRVCLFSFVFSFSSSGVGVLMGGGGGGLITEVSRRSTAQVVLGRVERIRGGGGGWQ